MFAASVRNCETQITIFYTCRTIIKMITITVIYDRRKLKVHVDVKFKYYYDDEANYKMRKSQTGST